MKAEFQALDKTVPIRLASYRNRVVVLALWAEWCWPCRLSLEALNGLNREFESRGVKIIGLAAGDPASDADKTRAFVNNSKINFQIGWINEELLRALNDQGSIPQIYVIAGDGVVVKKFAGWPPAKGLARMRQAVRLALKNRSVG